MGPRYQDFVGSYRDQQRWVGSWDGHYHKQFELEKLRQMEEVYAAKILDYQDVDIARIRVMRSRAAKCWHGLSVDPPQGIVLPVLENHEASDPGHMTPSASWVPTSAWVWPRWRPVLAT